MYELVNYNGWTSYVSNYLYCCRPIRPEALLYNDEHHLLATAKCLVYVLVCFMMML